MLVLLLFAVFASVVNAQYQVPDAIVTAYHPKGFSVSIPDEEGITLFAFHGKINEEFEGREAGTFSIDIPRPRNGLWTFSDTTTRLRVGDVIYFWTFVQYFDGTNQLGFVRDNQNFTVSAESNNKLTLVQPGRHEILPRTYENQNPEDPTCSKDLSEPPLNTADRTFGHNLGPEVMAMEELFHKANGKPFNKGTISTITTTFRTPVSTGTNQVCEPTVTVSNGKSSCKGKQILNEEFSEISQKYWSFETRIAEKPDYEFVVYDTRKETIFTSENVLGIKPILADSLYGPEYVNTPLDLGNRCTGAKGTAECRLSPDAGFIVPPVLSSLITTKNKFSFKYGKIEIIAKLPKGDWIYPILTLNPVKEEYGTGYESGQIRIAFTRDTNRSYREVYGGVILGTSPKARSYGLKYLTQLQGWSTEYHKFGVIWKPDSIELTVNGKLYGRIDPPAGGFSTLASELKLKNSERWNSGTIIAPFDKEMYISLGVGVGGFNFEDRNDGTKPWKNGERLSVKKFYEAQKEWSSTWNDESVLYVSSVKVWAI